MTSLIEQLLIEEEGRIPYAYQDSLGFLTIGVGHLIDRRKGGRLPDFIIDQILKNDIDEKLGQAKTIPGFERMNEVQQAAIVSMVFQLGIGGVKGFPAMLRALAAGDWKEAAIQGCDSKWAKQDTPRRAERQMKMIESGIWVPHGG